jgi:hypothetical protein
MNYTDEDVAELVDAVRYALRTRDDAGSLSDTAEHNLRVALSPFEPEPTYAEKLHSGARLHMAHGADIETAKRMASLAIRAGDEDH